MLVTPKGQRVKVRHRFVWYVTNSLLSPYRVRVRVRVTIHKIFHCIIASYVRENKQCFTEYPKVMY